MQWLHTQLTELTNLLFILLLRSVGAKPEETERQRQKVLLCLRYIPRNLHTTSGGKLSEETKHNKINKAFWSYGRKSFHMMLTSNTFSFGNTEYGRTFCSPDIKCDNPSKFRTVIVYSLFPQI